MSPSSTRISIARVTVNRLTRGARAASFGSLSMRSPGCLLAMSSATSPRAGDRAAGRARTGGLRKRRRSRAVIRLTGQVKHRRPAKASLRSGRDAPPPPARRSSTAPRRLAASRPRMIGIDRASFRAGAAPDRTAKSGARRSARLGGSRAVTLRISLSSVGSDAARRSRGQSSQRKRSPSAEPIVGLVLSAVMV